VLQARRDWSGADLARPVTGIDETSVRALAKLEQVMPPRLRHQVGAVADYTVPIPHDSPAPATR
jgi:hypothetical protein